MARVLAGLATGLALGGCGGEPEAEVTTVPKETASEPAPQPGMPDLPLAGERSGLPDWEIPAEWQEAGAGGVRLASFAADGPAGPVDISVTAFPGDVGGLEANLNRWRNQIGLAPLAAGDLESGIERLRIGETEAIIARMSSTSEATHAAIIEGGTETWFIKMTGPRASVEAQASAFGQFVSSIRFAGEN